VLKSHRSSTRRRCPQPKADVRHRGENCRQCTPILAIRHHGR